MATHALDIMRTRITETNKHLNELVNQKTGQLVDMNKDLIESKNRLESLNESLILSDKAKEEFIMMVSRELKTPITPPKIYMEILLTSKSLGNLNEKQKQYFDRLMHSIKTGKPFYHYVAGSAGVESRFSLKL